MHTWCLLVCPIQEFLKVASTRSQGGWGRQPQTHDRKQSISTETLTQIASGGEVKVGPTAPLCFGHFRPFSNSEQTYLVAMVLKDGGRAESFMKTLSPAFSSFL
ncbi:hypothetical protein H6P81_010674 [Aristolochia fimbriata]|uniref:Uncharacterized protein n=1 Tax=Aristolochia fimbriata TaxID=158543 RepID=A0AAV7EQ30_ARIFI|nr:hypothetical protein H6P81_010674 [Aristolochia fimbriata]